MWIHRSRNGKTKNRIYITIGKLEGEAEMQAISQTVKTQCQTLKKGFTCISDLRKYEIQDDLFEDYVKQTQKALIDAGMSRVVRVVRVRRETGLLGHFQFDNASADVGYHAENVTSVEAAEKILDEKTG